MIGSSADGGTVTDPVRYVNNIAGTLTLGIWQLSNFFCRSLSPAKKSVAIVFAPKEVIYPWRCGVGVRTQIISRVK
jgi:hypothetical protein